MIKIPLTRGKIATIDDNDEWITQYKWYAGKGNKDGTLWYAMRKKRMENQKWKSIYIHREIMEVILGYSVPSGYIVDHIDGDSLNNRRNNIRLATVSQNRQNSNKAKNCKSKSKYKGVYIYILATIKINGKSINLGNFDNEEDAAHAYDKAAKKYFGEFSRLNFSD